ncbi:hypothetical protein HPB49_017440 [Dermacentor silvarum]|uniref:Uncharacterized protein n=1 Tax=Dermacentor silvarum TaxID=543639 RepID=A0ACB8CGJ5_DERSI|nr:hypothetical protein HPB49_017440 [Dermacentor silvarum]
MDARPLQTAASVMDKYAKECDLRCSPQKSELVVVRQRAPNRLNDDIKVVLDGEDIVADPRVKILELVIQTKKVEASVRKLKHTTEQILHMLCRVTTIR